MNIFRHERKATFFTLAVLCLFLAVLAWFLIPRFGTIGTDGSFYALLGKNISEGRGFTTYGEAHTVYNPLLPFLIAGAFFFTTDMDTAAHVPGVLLLLAMIPVMYFLGTAVAGRRAGIYSAALTALSGAVIWPSVNTPNAQIVAGFFALLFLLLLHRAIRAFPDDDKTVSVFLLSSGVALALAYLARPEYIMLPFFALIVILFFRRTASMRKKLLFCSAFLGGFLLFAGPYIAYLSSAQGQFSISGRTNGAVLYMARGPEEGTAAAETDDGVSGNVRPVPLHEDIGEILKNNTFPIIKRVLKGYLHTEHSIVINYGFVGMIVLGLGLRAMFLRKHWVELSLLAVGLMPMAATAAYTGGEGFYLFQFYPILNIVLAVGIVALLEEAEKYFAFTTARKHLVNMMAISSLGFYLFFPAAQLYLFLPPDYQDQEYTQLGNWMRVHVPHIESTRVVSRKPEPVIRAGGLYVPTPPVATSTGAFVGYMRRVGAEYFIADSRVWGRENSTFAGLVERTDVPKEFEFIYETVYAGQRAVLYRFVSVGNKEE